MRGGCSVAGCQRRHKGRGFCQFHLVRFREGRPLDAPMPERTRGLSLAGRLAAHSRRSPSGCLLWTKACDQNGYGRITVRGRRQSTHRVSYEHAFGAIPPGMMVCHRCDVRNCIEPSHLFLGTAKDNTHDMIQKARHAHGSRTGNAVLTEAEVLEARLRVSQGESIGAVIRDYSSPSGMESAIRGGSWRHVPNPLRPRPEPPLHGAPHA